MRLACSWSLVGTLLAACAAPTQTSGAASEVNDTSDDDAEDGNDDDDSTGGGGDDATGDDGADDDDAPGGDDAPVGVPGTDDDDGVAEPETPTGTEPTPAVPNPDAPVTPGPDTPAPTVPAPATPTNECATTGDALPIDASGWVSGACNSFAVQGAWYCYTDGINATDCPSAGPPFDAGLGAMCLRGSTTVDPTYAAWGAGLGLTLNQAEGATTGAAYDATATGLLGFRLSLSGNAGGNPVRVHFTGGTSTGAAPFVDIAALGVVDVWIADAVVPTTWDVPEAGTRANLAAVYDLQLAIAGGDRASNYEICIESITLLGTSTTPAPSPGPTEPGPVNPSPSPSPAPGPTTGGPVAGGGVRGTAAEEAWQAVGPNATQAPLGSAEPPGPITEGVGCTEDNYGIGWCTSQSSLLYCDQGEWIPVDCPDLDPAAYCGFYADAIMVDCVLPEVVPTPSCESSLDCAVGESCSEYCAGQDCYTACARSCNGAFDVCNSTAEQQFVCWGRQYEEACMQACYLDEECPAGQQCVPHAVIPDGSDFNGEEGYCRPPCVTDDDCVEMSQGQVGQGSLTCTCVSNGHCVLDPNEDELGFQCYHHRTQF